MKMIEVKNSSNLRALGYDSETRQLEAHFKGGGQYKYDEVPRDLWEEIDDLIRRRNEGEDVSVGSSFYKKVIKGGFKYEKIAD